MPIKIIKQGDDQYMAEVTPPQGSWRSPHPMPSFELYRKLFPVVYNVSPDSIYLYVADITRPFLQEALAGEREVPKQSPFTEAWLTDALFYYDRMLSLRDVLESADAINHDIPNYDEISWAFLRLRKRGWLVVEGDMYGLTPEGRRAVKKIVDRGEPPLPVRKLEEWIYWKTFISILPRRTGPIEKLEKWISANPPPGDE